MLKKQNRLGRVARTKDDRLFTSPLFNLRISDNKENRIKFAFIVSKKIDKRAVVRNQTKRILRSAVESIIDKIELGRNVIVISRKVLAPEQKEQVNESMGEIFRKAGIINE
jgi:ribonuclease P protein component